MRLKDKIAIISGVGNRFGKATAFLFAKEGAKVILISRTTKLISEITQEINKNGGEAHYFNCDSTNPELVKSLVEQIIKQFGKIDIVFNNVGGNYTKKQTAENMDFEFWNQVIKNNIVGAYLFSKYTLPFMRLQMGGTIVNVAAATKTLIDGNNAYCTAKEGIIGMTKNLASEYAKFNIRVNCVCPGVVRENTSNYDFDGFIPHLNKKGQSEDIAYAVLFLASEESSWITGQTITIDGGEEVFVDIPKH